ncbi:MAG: hypothetical protein AABN95_18445 [Acidobacteriota bacterium]
MARMGHNGNGHGKTHVTETPDVSHIKNVDVTHEESDVNVGGILKFVLGLTIFGVVVAVLMWGTFRFLNAQEVKKEPEPGPMAMTKDERLPPEPRLQAAPGFGVKLEDGKWIPLQNREPEAEYRVLRDQWETKLTCEEPPRKQHETAGSSDHAAPAHTEQKDASHRSPCLPIDEAIQKLVEKSLPTRTASTTPEDVALPTAASSGRVTGKERP